MKRTGVIILQSISLFLTLSVLAIALLAFFIQGDFLLFFTSYPLTESVFPYASVIKACLLIGLQVLTLVVLASTSIRKTRFKAILFLILFLLFNLIIFLLTPILTYLVSLRGVEMITSYATIEQAISSMSSPALLIASGLYLFSLGMYYTLWRFHQKKEAPKPFQPGQYGNASSEAPQPFQPAAAQYGNASSEAPQPFQPAATVFEPTSSAPAESNE